VEAEGVEAEVVAILSSVEPRYRHWQNRAKGGQTAFITTTCLDFCRALERPETKDLMVRSLLEDCRFYGVAPQAWVVMIHHLHLLVRLPEERDISWFVQRLKSNSAKLILPTLTPEELSGFDHQQGLNGRSFWKRGFRSIVVDTEKVYFQKASSIHWNPVKARLCQRPSDYRWSSARLWNRECWSRDEGGCCRRDISAKRSEAVASTRSVWRHQLSQEPLDWSILTTIMKVRDVFVCGAFVAVGCQGSKTAAPEEAPVNRKIEVSSSAFQDGQPVPLAYTAYGDNKPPAISWQGAPQEAKSVLLRLEDPDAVRNPPFVHWLVANLPVEGKIGEGEIPPGAVQGRNDHGDSGYFGPRPPAGSGTHHYEFHVYALDAVPDLKEGFGKDEAARAMDGHILAEGVLVGTYQKG
jgi:Raf kinase inhibitor-like YbhB/YbcL family protein